jgi:hypothetical protein
MGFLEFGFGFEHQPEPEPYIKLVSTLHAKCIAKMLFPTPGVVYHEDLTVHVTVHVIERYMKLRMRTALSMADIWIEEAFGKGIARDTIYRPKRQSAPNKRIWEGYLLVLTSDICTPWPVWKWAVEAFLNRA